MLARWLYLLNVSAWLLLFSSSVFQCLAQQAGSLQNISIANTSPQIDYTPFLCNVTGSATFDPSCLGGWQVLTLGGQTVVSTEGAGPQGANIVPQMFLRFNASALFLTTSPSSNATVNIAVSAGNTAVNVSTDSSIGVAAILNLSEDETTTLSLTFVAGQTPSRLDIGGITIEIADTSSTSTASFLPTPTLPPTVSLPTFIPVSSSTSSTTSSSASSTPTQASSSSSHKQLINDALGLTLGLGLGLTLVVSVGYYIWKRRRRRRQNDVEWRGDTQSRRSLGFRRTNAESTRWF